MRSPRVLVVGTSSPNADMVSQVLASHGIRSNWTDRVKRPNPFLMRKFDVVYGIYLQTCSRYIVVAKLLGKKTIIHFVGSDAYWMARERSLWRRAYWKIVLWLTDVLLYVSPHLRDLVGREGLTVPFPIATDSFRLAITTPVEATRDILYYCPGGPINERIYRLNWIVDYARTHLNETITIIGSLAHPARYSIPLPNVEVIPCVELSEMPSIYRKHRKLIRMTTEDGLPRMIHEALLSGLQVIFNGREVRDIPREREPSNFASTIEKVLESLDD